MDARRSKAPRKKAGAPREKPYPLPVPIGPHAETSYWPVYTGYLSGDRVYVRQREAVIRLYRMGYFGKGTLSKHAPMFHRDRKAELFDLKQHLQKITHKVFLTRSFRGSLASGCRGPAQLVSAASLARQQPFTPDHCGVVGSQSEVPEIAVVAKLVDRDSSSCTDLSALDATNRLTAEPARLAPSDDARDSGVSTPFCSASAVAAAAAVAADPWPEAAAARVAAWESMEPDVDFWLSGTEQASSLLSDVPAATGEADLPSSAGASRLPDPPTAIDFAMGSSCISSSDAALQLSQLHDSASARDVFPATQAEQTSESATMPSDPPAMEMGDVRCEETSEDEDHPSADAALPMLKGELASTCDDTAKEGAVLEGDVGEPDDKTTAEEKTGRKEKQIVLCEHLELLMEEAYFLAYGLGCLRVVYNDSCDAAIGSRHDPDGSESKKNVDAHGHDCADNLGYGSRRHLGLGSLWSVMCAQDPRFLPRYVAYHYLRSKGWVPRDGLRFGVDFVVYKTGPPFYHASYSVIVMATHSDASLTPADSFPVGRAWTWASLAGVNRVTENVNKELLICYVVLPVGWTVEQLFQTPNCIKHCRVQFVHMQRLITSKEREAEKSACGSP